MWIGHTHQITVKIMGIIYRKTLLKFDLQFPLAFLVRLSCCLERKTLKLFPEAESNERPKKLFLPPTS